MREAGLVGASHRRGGPTTTRRDKDARPAPDLVDRNFTADRHRTSCGSPTSPYVPTAAGFLYLAVVLDAWSRKIVGWSMANHLRTELVLDAMEMAVGQRRPTDVIHHSDQGSQYTSVAFGRRCGEAGVRPSMGSVGDAYDNAMAESFFSTLECRAAQPPPVRVPGRSQDGLLQLHRGLLQSGPVAFSHRISVAAHPL